MRICLVSREYPPETGWGGIATFTQHLAQGLKEIGNDVVVVTLAEGAAKTVDDNGVTVYRVQPFAIPGDLGAVAMCMPYSRSVMKNVAALWQKFLELHEQEPFDVVDTPELLAEGILPALTKVVPLTIRLYTPHFKFIADKLHNISATFDHQFIAMLERIALINADAITSPSNDLADFVAEETAIPREKIKLIYNPIDPVHFSPEGPQALPAVEGGHRVLFVGRLEERKGINYLVHAIPAILQSCPETEFVIIGADTINAAGGQRSVLNDLRDFLTRSRVIDRVKFISRVPLDQLPDYYRSADICVVPSVYDNSPYTCLEAMSCGRAVIGTSGGGIKEYLVNGDSGMIVPPRDSNALTDSIVYLLKDGKARLRMGEGARARVLAKFQRKQIAKETQALYEEARANFATTRKQYVKETDQALSDAAVLMYTFDKMIYDLLYKQSYRFRIRHWWRLSVTRPRLLAVRMVLRVATAVSPKASPPAFVQWLQKQIRQKQEDPLAELAARTTAGSRNRDI